MKRHAPAVCSALAFRGLVLAGALALLGTPAAAQTYIAKDRLNPGPGLESQEEFGSAVALLGDRALVGGPRHDGQGTDRGAAYVFKRQAGSFVLEAQLAASDGLDFDRFGSAVDLDGALAAIGAPRHSSVFPDGGAVYIFKRNLIQWSEIAKLDPFDVQADDFFGASLDLEGNTLVVGAPREDDGGIDAGAVYVFEFDDVKNEWVEEQKIFNPNPPLAGDWFGTSVSVEGDLLVVGSRFDDPQSKGALHAFIRQGENFVFEETLVPADAIQGDQLGISVDIDGDTMVAGALLSNSPKIQNVGAVYVYRRQAGRWVLGQKITHTGNENDRFSETLSLCGDLLAVGAPEEDGEVRGAAYVFERSGASFGSPRRISAEEIGSGDNFGTAVSLDGSAFAVGARRDDRDGSNAGAAWQIELRDCREGGVNRGAGAVTDVLFVNGETGNEERRIFLNLGDPVVASIQRPPLSGNGKFFVHMSAGAPTEQTLSPLPAKLGSSCHPLLLNQGADPRSNWNNVGKEQKIGESQLFGTPIADPERAPVTFLDLPNGDAQNLPPGTTVTLQGAIIDPGTVSTKGASLTNAILLGFL